MREDTKRQLSQNLAKQSPSELDRNAGTVLISSAEVSRLRSPYLHEGWRNEEFLMHSISHCPSRRISANLDVVRFEPDSLGKFHLSALQAFVWLQQLAVILGSLEQKTSKEEMGEVYLRKCDWKFVRPIHETNDVSIRIDITQLRELPSETLFRGLFDLQSGSMTGYLSGIFPRPSARHSIKTK